MLEKFPSYLVNEDGVFKEWAYAPYVEGFNHRHMSHSYPVWPAHELSWEQHPALMTAMRVALEKRLPQDWSGHNFAIRAFCAARTKYPSLFSQNLHSLMRFDFIQPDLVTRHNPGWCPNTDVLCGLPGFVSEALVYSKPGVIELLPAWSRKLPAGSVKGILCRGQAKVDLLQWDLQRKSVKATLSSTKDQRVTLFARQGIASITADAQLKASEHRSIARELHLKKGQPVTVSITLDKAINDYPVNTPALTWEDALRMHNERVARKKAKN